MLKKQIKVGENIRSLVSVVNIRAPISLSLSFSREGFPLATEPPERGRYADCAYTSSESDITQPSLIHAISCGRELRLRQAPGVSKPSCALTIAWRSGLDAQTTAPAMRSPIPRAGDEGTAWERNADSVLRGGQEIVASEKRCLPLLLFSFNLRTLQSTAYIGGLQTPARGSNPAREDLQSGPWLAVVLPMKPSPWPAAAGAKISARTETETVK